MSWLVMRRKASAASWRLITSGARHPGVIVTFGVLGWMLWPLQTYVILVVLTAVALLGDDRLRRSSIVADAVKFSYRRARIRFRWSKVMQAARLQELRRHPGQADVFAHPQLMHAHWWSHRFTWRRWHTRVRQTPTGITVTVDGTNVGVPHSGFEGSSATAIQSAFKANDLTVDQHPKWGHLTQLTLAYKDPFDQEIPASCLGTSPRMATIPIGKDARGTIVGADLRLAWLVIGNLGSGKSKFAWLVLKGLVEQGIPFRVRIADPKGGLEFARCRTCAYDYESKPTRLVNFLEKAIADLETRLREMRALGFDEWSPEDPTFPLSLFPLDLMIIDELVAFVILMGDAKILIDGKRYSAMDAFAYYLSMIRAAGFTVVACSQLAQKKFLDLVRDLFTNKMCFRVGSVDITRIMLGDGNTYPAHKISKYRPGVGYVDEGDGPRKIRTAHITDAERDSVVALIDVQKTINVEFTPTEQLVTNGAPK